MKVVSHQSLAQSKLPRIYLMMGVFGVLMVVGYVGYVFFSSSLVFAGIAFVGLSVFGDVVMNAFPWIRGNSGEKQVLKALEGLSDEYTVVQNWVPPGKKGDVDMLVLGPHGALVVEVKNYRAGYACEGDDWFNVKENGYRQRMKSPSKQLARNVKAVQKAVGRRALVSGVLVLPPNANVQVSNPTVEILPWDRLATWVQALPRSTATVDPSAFGHHPYANGVRDDVTLP